MTRSCCVSSSRCQALPFVHPAGNCTSELCAVFATSLDGPWEPLSPNTLGGCNNPAPWVHPRNGTIFIVSFLTAVVGLVIETGRDLI